jgi:hypothetical protein
MDIADLPIICDIASRRIPEHVWVTTMFGEQGLLIDFLPGKSGTTVIIHFNPIRDFQTILFDAVEEHIYSLEQAEDWRLRKRPEGGWSLMLVDEVWSK